MQRAADRTTLCEAQSDSFGVILSELISLAGHVQASINLIEAAIARDLPPDAQDAGNMVVLDDVTPRYIRASCALNACNASLGTVLRFLLDARMLGRHSIPLAAH